MPQYPRAEKPECEHQWKTLSRHYVGSNDGDAWSTMWERCTKCFLSRQTKKEKNP